MCTIHEINEINDTQIHNAKDLDVVMPMYNLVEHMITIAKTSGSFWQYHKDDPNDTKSKLLLIQIQGKSNRKNAGNTKDVQIAMPFKYLSNFWKALDIPLINFEVNITLT